MSSTATSNLSPAVDERERLGAALDGDRFHPPRARMPRDDLAVRRVVVDDEDALPEELRQGSSAVGRVGSSAGSAVSAMRNVEPLPSSLSARMVPPISSTRRFEIARPSPVPP